jgi:hypothetical protein
MFHALTILLHRPFVPEGHLKSVADSASNNAFSVCETAALEIDAILRWYKTQFCIKSPPYFLSYATYVSATIHVRIAAQHPQKSNAHRCLRNCLEILSEHQSVCHAPRRAMAILLRLAKRLKVDVGGVFTASASRTEACGISRLEGDNEGPRVESISPWLESPSDVITTSQRRSLGAVGTMESVNLTTGHATEPSNAGIGPNDLSTTRVDCNPLGQMESVWPSVSHEMEGLFQDVTFDFDPLFGFDISQMDPETDFQF